MAKASKKATKKAASSASLHNVRFPGESAGYRGARNKLLQAEIELRREIERVAAERRKLPAGGAVPEDYVFEESAPGGAARRVRLSDLFGDKDTLAAYSFMYGPAMQRPCPSCTSILDALDRNAQSIGQRVALVAIAKSPIDRIHAFANERGWSKLRLLSSAANNYNRDYRGETANGSQIPSLNVFVRRDGNIHHFYNTEMLFGPKDPGMDHRHVDMIWPLWNLFDFTPDGRGANWYPKLSYDS
jgi:predicted dithiol-disulfide oxidoreductase (DUF899 family)